MQRNKLHLALVATFAATVVPQLVLAQKVTIRQDDVIPVVIETTLSISDSRVGDRFRARVADGRDLPYETRFEGKVTAIRRATDRRPATMDLQFTDVILPGNKRQGIRATPVPLTDLYVARGGDGRFVARLDDRRKEKKVFGGLIGGLVVGSIFKKPAEGAILGILAGIASAETDKAGNGDLVLRSGTKIGALFEKNATLTWNYRDERRDDRYYDRDNRDSRYDRDTRDNRDNRDIRDDRDRYNRDDQDRDEWDHESDRRNDRDRRESIRYGNRDLVFNRNDQPYRQNDLVMVPLDQACGQMGLKVDRRGGVFYIENDEFLLKAELDSREYRLNGRRLTSKQSIIERDGVIYVPINLLASTCRTPVMVNGSRIVIED